MKRIDATFAALDELRVDALALCLTEGCHPLRGMAGLVDWRLCGRLSRMMVKGSVTGRDGETALTPSTIPAIRRVFVFGFGPEAGMVDRANQRFAQVARVLDDAKVESVALELPHPGEPLWGRAEKVLGAALSDRLLGAFSPEDRWAPPAAS